MKALEGLLYMECFVKALESNLLELQDRNRFVGVGGFALQ